MLGGRTWTFTRSRAIVRAVAAPTLITAWALTDVDKRTVPLRSNLFTLPESGKSAWERGKAIFEAARGRVSDACNDASERPVLYIIGACAAVQAGWIVLPTRFMARHFMSSWGGLIARRRPWTLMTANFSHAGPLHFAGNMWVVWILGPTLVDGLRSEARFYELYGAAGVLGMAASAAWKALAGRKWDNTVGASGCAVALFAAQVALDPDSERTVFGVHMTARDTAALVAVVDVAVAYFMRPQVALAAHAAGALVGVVYANAIRETIRWESERNRGWRGLLKKEDAPPLTTLIWRRVVGER